MNYRKGLITYDIFFKPRGVCTREIKFDLDGDVVKNVHFTGGCKGNLKGISALVDGLTIDEITAKLEGIRCGFKSTSCPDQLVKAINESVK